MNTDFQITDLCPSADRRLKNIPHVHLLNRRIMDKNVFNTFSAPWFRRGQKAAERGDWMEALIYLWVTFNAWTSLVVADQRQSERDSYLWKAAGLDPTLATRFQQLLSNNESFQKNVQRFRDLWPVFKVRSLVDKNLESWGAWASQESRAEYRARCFHLVVSDFSPRCYQAHQPHSGQASESSPSNVPLDWSHTLGAIYQVRCNLFHGGKSFLNSRDVEFTELAYLILSDVWREDFSAT